MSHLYSMIQSAMIFIALACLFQKEIQSKLIQDGPSRSEVVRNCFKRFYRPSLPYFSLVCHVYVIKKSCPNGSKIGLPQFSLVCHTILIKQNGLNWFKKGQVGLNWSKIVSFVLFDPVCHNVLLKYQVQIGIKWSKQVQIGQKLSHLVSQDLPVITLIGLPSFSFHKSGPNWSKMFQVGLRLSKIV